MFINNDAFTYSLTGSIEPSSTEPSTARRSNVGNKSSNNKGKSVTYLYDNNPPDLTINIDFLDCHFDDNGQDYGYLVVSFFSFLFVNVASVCTSRDYKLHYAQSVCGRGCIAQCRLPDYLGPTDNPTFTTPFFLFWQTRLDTNELRTSYLILQLQYPPGDTDIYYNKYTVILLSYNKVFLTLVT